MRIIDLAGEGLSTEEIIREVRPGGSSAEAEDEVDPAASSPSPEMVLEFQVMRETLARQERRLAHLVAEVEREREERAREVKALQATIAGLQKENAVIAEWVDYFDRQMDEVTLPASERIRRIFRGRAG